MNLQELKIYLESKLDSCFVAKIYLDTMRVIDEESRNSSSYHDCRFVPFYYYLGEVLKPKHVLEIGFGLGFFIGNFLKSSKEVEKVLLFQEKRKDFFSGRIGISNVKDNFKGDLKYYYGNIFDDKFDAILNLYNLDLCILSENVSYDQYKNYLEVIWNRLNENGLIAFEYLKKHKFAEMAYLDFCKIKNKEPIIVNTRYNVGLIRK